jgi:DNA-binding PadR family transcriptional regulator
MFSPGLITRDIGMQSPRKQTGNTHGNHLNSVERPRGVPRGLLLHYILHKLEIKPAYGYELLKDIDCKTEGGWRPGPGSVYPMLKKLLLRGYIKVDVLKDGERPRRLYSITQKGIAHLRETKNMFADMSQRWGSIRCLFVDMIETEHIPKFLIDGFKQYFELAHEIVKSRGSSLNPNELAYVLKEYSLNLEREVYWAQNTLKLIQVGKSSDISADGGQM